MYHIKVEGESWCQAEIPSSCFLALAERCDRSFSTTCNHFSKESAEMMVAFLAEVGIKATVEEGPCRADRESYYDDEDESE
jgi:hypothetical protein